MNKQEFIERTGLTPTSEEYEAIEALYMAAGEMDKDEFCKEYKKHGTSRLVSVLFKETKVLKGQLEEANNIIEDLREQKSQMLDFLIEQAEKWSASDLREKAIKILGAKEYLRRKVEKGFNLWESDRELLIELLG